MIIINNHLREVWQGGWSVFVRKARRALRLRNEAFLYLLHASWAVPVLIAMRVLRPFVLIRVGEFRVERIGHFAADVGQRKAQSLVDRSRKKLDFWYLPSDKECSNAYDFCGMHSI